MGDWQGDTVVGQGTTRIATRLDRKSSWTRLRKVPDGTTTVVAEAVFSVLYPVRTRVHTLTWDNGSEFAEHRLIDLGLEAQSYAMPYSSLQRGCNESLSGPLRQHLRKGRDFAQFTDEQIPQIEDKLNRRARKRLNYRTHEQVFGLSFKRIALRG